MGYVHAERGVSIYRKLKGKSKRRRSKRESGENQRAIYVKRRNRRERDSYLQRELERAACLTIKECEREIESEEIKNEL